MPEITEKKARRTKSSRDLCESEAAQAVPQHILNIVKNVEKRAKKSKKGKPSADHTNKTSFAPFVLYTFIIHCGHSIHFCLPDMLTYTEHEMKIKENMDSIALIRSMMSRNGWLNSTITSTIPVLYLFLSLSID